MKVLVVKTSSMGDLLHTLPALTDAALALPQVDFDWVVEESFAEIPGWHPAVATVIPIAMRRWRRQLREGFRSGEIAAAVRDLRACRYDVIIDAQGLIKSALVARLARGTRCGMAWSSCREPLASLAYQRRYPVPKGQHAIDRVRQLFAAVLNYPYDEQRLDFGLHPGRFAAPDRPQPYLLFLHGTSWPSKLWPQQSWIGLARKAAEAGYRVLLPWGHAAERKRAEEIALACENAEVLPRMQLRRIAGLIAKARGVVGVDTGLAHLTAALGTPGVTLYRATSPALTGARGARQLCLSEPRGRAAAAGSHSSALSVDVVWQALLGQMA